MGIYVKSTLSINFGRAVIPGKYWCRVLLKTLDNYSYSVAGQSSAITKILSSDEYLAKELHFPPCVGKPTFHRPHLECVAKDRMGGTSESVNSCSPLSNSDAIIIKSGTLAGIVIAGGILVVILLVLILVVSYSCWIINGKKEHTGMLSLDGQLLWEEKLIIIE